MFTGIVEQIGTVKSVAKGAKSASITFSADEVLKGTKIGDSIAVNGVCLTVTELTDKTFTVDVMHETFNRTSLANLVSGKHVNLERAMPADGRFGGHIVSGHIDGTGKIASIKRDDNAVWVEVLADDKILRYIVEKGSVAIDGVSLTVAKVTNKTFSVSLIPHTMKQTILHEKRVSDIVNLENDIIGKYVEKMLQNNQADKQENKSKITKEFLLRNGF